MSTDMKMKLVQEEKLTVRIPDGVRCRAPAE